MSDYTDKTMPDSHKNAQDAFYHMQVHVSWPSEPPRGMPVEPTGAYGSVREERLSKAKTAFPVDPLAGI